MTDDKRTQGLRVWVSEPLELELRRLAENDGRKLGEYCGFVLQRWVYGHRIRVGDEVVHDNEAMRSD